MPSRNTVRYDAPNSYYHVYARGASKQNIFVESVDKDYFLYLLSRHLSLKPIVNKQGYTYPLYKDALELLTYCLMDNHFHLLIYQIESGTIAKLMRSVLVAYTAYFNSKYKRSGPLLESRYKAAVVDKDEYLLHVARYILLNPRSWKRYPYSSINYIRNHTEPEWLKTDKILQSHTDRQSFLEFVSDYEEAKEMLSDIKYQLANM